MTFTITVNVPMYEDEEHLRTIVYNTLDSVLTELSGTFGISWSIIAIVKEEYGKQ